MIRGPRVFPLAALAAAAVLSVSVAAPAAQPGVDAGSVVQMTGELLAAHGHLLKEDQRGRLDALYRRAKEAEQSRDAAAQASTASDILQELAGTAGLVVLTLSPERLSLPPLQPVEFQGDVGAMLLRVEIAGTDGPARGAVHILDHGSQPEAMTTVTVAPEGTTWLLLRLLSLPKDRTDQRLMIKAGSRSWGVQLEYRRAPVGRLALTVLDDDTGEPTPAMVQLVYGLDGAVRRPPNAIELAPQFDGQGHLTGRRHAIIPGPVEGDYWCVTGPFDMEVAPGEWKILVRRGVEHAPATAAVKVESGRTTRVTLRPPRWVDMPGLGWFSGDDHVHCRILDDLDAANLMAYARAEDVHVVNVVKMGDIYRTWFEQRGFGPEYRVVAGRHVLSPGQECPRTHDGGIGHTLAMNTRRMIRDTDRYYIYEWVFDQVHAEGGLCGYAHINSGIFRVHRDMAINIPKGKADFGEVLQFASLGTDLWYRFLNTGFKLTASAGSDIPWGGTMGEVRVYAHLGDQPFSADAWFEAFGRGRTFVTNGPMLTLTVDDALPGDEIVVAENRMLRVRARAWGDPRRVRPTRLEIIRHGEAVRTVEAAAGDGPAELSVDMEVPAGAGFWIAARAEGEHGERAHTTPVYVIRRGLRFWKHDQAESLIDQGLASLAEVEKLVAEASEADAQGRIEDDRTLKQLAVQGRELLRCVRESRQIWDELRAVARSEAAIRATLK